MSSTELMSKSTGSALGLTGGRTERYDEHEGGRDGGGRGREAEKDLQSVHGEKEKP